MVLLLSIMLSSLAFAMPPGQAKKTLPPGQAKKFMNYVKDKGIMYGYGNGDYGFNDYVKRGDITVMIVRAFKLNMMDADINQINNDDFLDLIDKNSYYYSAVKTAKNLGIAQGDGKNYYPKNNVTLNEAMLLIERSVKVANSNVTVLNEDGKEIKLRDWYKDKFTKVEKSSKNTLQEEETFRNYLIEILRDEGKIEQKKVSSKNDKYLTNRLNMPATREEIALMLYYVLTGDNLDREEELDADIIVELKNLYGENIDFKKLMARNGALVKELNAIQNDENILINYVSFDDVSGGSLYHKYDTKNQAKVTDKDKFYIDGDTDNDGKLEEKEISDITFVHNKKNNKNVFIEFTAYAETNTRKVNSVEYSGLIIISENYRKLPLIKETLQENTSLYFKDLDLEDDLEDYKIEEIKFLLPDKKEGKLVINLTRNTTKDLLNERYDIEDLEDIKFIPALDFTGKIEIEYTAYDENNIFFNGAIEITVLEVYEIKDILIKSYEYDDEIDFVDELEYIADEDVYDDIDYLIFNLPKEKEGKLYIKYNRESLNPVLDNKEYELDGIKYLKFKPYDEDVEKVTVFYSAYNMKTDKKYDGAMVIDIDK